MAVRLTQEPVEAVVQPSGRKARLSQLPVETVLVPATRYARLSQLPVEVVLAVGTPPASTWTPRIILGL